MIKGKNTRNLAGKESVLLDIRTQEEFVGFHLEGALNIPLDELDQSIKVIRQWKRPVIVYGAEDQRSQLAVTKLRNHGIEAYDAGSYARDYQSSYRS